MKINFKIRKILKESVKRLKEEEVENTDNVQNAKKPEKEESKKYAAGFMGVNNRTRKILVGKRSNDVSDPNVWIFPAGKHEQGESLKKTAIREFGEETWYHGNFENIHRLYYQPGEYNFAMYIGTIVDFQPKMDSREFEQMEWVNFEEFLTNPKFEPKHPRMKEALSDDKILRRIKTYLSGVR